MKLSAKNILAPILSVLLSFSVVAYDNPEEDLKGVYALDLSELKNEKVLSQAYDDSEEDPEQVQAFITMLAEVDGTIDFHFVDNGYGQMTVDAGDFNYLQGSEKAKVYTFDYELIDGEYHLKTRKMEQEEGKSVVRIIKDTEDQMTLVIEEESFSKSFKLYKY